MEKFDVFQWANQIEEYKNNISCELFLFNKNYTPFKVRYSDKLAASVKAMFMLEAITYVNKEADKGLEQREYEESDGESHVVYRTNLENVTRAESLIHLVEKEYKDIEYFNDGGSGSEFKKIKGILAKFSYLGGDEGNKVFYIAKGIASSSALKGATSWELNGESFEPFAAELALKMPEDNQVAIVDGNVIIFNQTKFINLFQYDYKAQMLADAKAKEINEKYKLTLEEGMTINDLLQDKKPLAKKLNEIDIPNAMSQKQVIEYCDEMQLELMSDENDSIIIQDDKDLAMFINLINEDYFVSPVNGLRYEIKSKKLLGEPEGEAPRG